MPNINQISVPKYTSNQPYHYDYDNLPLDALIQRELLINNAVNINSEILRQSIGTAGSLSARLNQSINDDGSLKTTAINNALHNIGYHVDGIYDGVEYVRMALSEREKLSLVADEATNFSIGVQGPSDIVYMSDGLMILEPSTTIEWTVLNNQKIRADVTVGLTNPHIHFDTVEPLNENMPPDYQNYTTNLGTPYAEGSLRVYINGIRIFPDSYMPYEDGLGFSLQNPITINDSIRIDFTVSLS